MKLTMSTSWINTLLLSLLALGLPLQVSAASKSSNAVLLSSIKSLTLRGDKMTTARRVSAIPQLTCSGGSAQGLYEIDVMRCTNSGSSYGSSDVEWTCKASLPEEFKLGSTDVICEGYANPDDEYILKGSCGVEYRLALTELGEEKYGKRPNHQPRRGDHEPGNDTVAWLFWIIFGGVILWMLYAAFIRPRMENNGAPRPLPRTGFFGGGSNDDNNDDDAPPPYSPPGGGNSGKPSSKTTNYGTNTRTNPAPSGQAQPQANAGWRPGFWTGTAAGTAAGAAAGYMAGRGAQTQPQAPQGARGWGMGAQAPEERWQYGGQQNNGWGAGPSRTTSRSSSGSNGGGPSYSSTRHESTGFGSTSRR